MTITVSPFAEPWSIPDRDRPTFTINQTVTAATDDAVNETITNVTAVVDGTEPDLVITPGTTSVAITGSFQDPFVDAFTYVEPGESNNSMTPITVELVPNMPAGKLLYDLDQDMTAYTTKTFTVTVSYDISSVSQTPEVFTLTMKINNSWDGIYAFMGDYYDYLD